MRKKRVLLVDDHPLFREGLKSLIDRSTHYITVGEAGSGEEAVTMAKELKPDLITMDISLPEQSGIEASRVITGLLPKTSILVISMHPKFEFIAEAFKAGARGYLVKDTTSLKLIQAMDALCRGEFYLDGGASSEIVTKLLAENRGAAGESNDDRYELLSPREQQVMRLIAEGGTTREIAGQLGLSPKTIENHRTNLMKKLNVHSKVELIRYAVKLGLIDIDQWKD